MIEKLKNINYSTAECFDNNKLAVILTAFNRFDLFNEVIDSMNNSDELQNIPIFLYLDGGNAKYQDLNIEAFKKLKFKNKYVIKRKQNLGCEKNTLQSLEDIFSILNFDFAFLIEDDIKLGKNFFKTCFERFKNIKQNLDKNIGIYQGFNMCFDSKEIKSRDIEKNIQTESDHHWGFLISKECYASLKKTLIDYINIVDSFPLNGNSKDAMIANKININNCFDAIIEKSIVKPSEYIINRYYKKQNNHCTLGWDGAFEVALGCSSFTRYKSKVNLCLNIGKNGEHFNEAIYKHLKLDQMTLDEVW